jgi:putative colanic acid biosynthesis UDP-glucose lipid carrier transferase
MQIRLSSPVLPYVFRIFDAIAVGLAGWLAIVIKGWVDQPIVVGDWTNYIVIVAIGALIYVASWGDLYQSWRDAALLSMLKGIYLRWAVVSGLILLGLFLFKTADEISRLWFLIWIFVGLALLFAERIGTYLILRFLRGIGYNHRYVVILGSGKVAIQLIERIRKATWSGYEIAQHIPYVNVEGLEQLEKSEVDEIWLALPLADEQLIKTALHGLRHSAASIRFVPDLFALRLINHEAIEIVGMPMFNISATPLTGLNQIVKWLEDKILSSIILLLICPIMLWLAIGVKLSSPGPVFYRQERVGLNNRSFMMLKFRSMPVDTEKAGVQWGGSAAKVTNRFGQFIRKTSLDELPQFLNVLRGDMSIVGPRPERAMFVDEFKEQIPDYMKKHLVKAGITGWAQINGLRGDTDLKERIQHDIYYIENWSLQLDLKIIFMTFYKGFVNKNAY